MPTLSGGEAQRIRLAAQLGSNLSGVLYMLDEPTIGLHARDNEQLLAALEKLKARGNSVVVVEHDEETMRRADYIIDLGPGAGVHGGEVVAAGTLGRTAAASGIGHRADACARTRGIQRAEAEGRQCAVRRRARLRLPMREMSETRCEACPYWLTLHGASENNLKNLTVQFPLGRLVLSRRERFGQEHADSRMPVAGAAAAALRNANRKTRDASDFVRLSNRSRPFTKWTSRPSAARRARFPRPTSGFFDDIRQLFAQVPEARLRGYSPSRFSFNSAQGRCPECEGAGQIKLEMNFLPPAFVRCETCGGTRFNRETLDIEYGGKNIAQVLELSVEEAMEFFASVPRIKRPLQALCDTGLGYLKLGQTSPTLSGGEAQRVKLVTHLLTGLREAQQLSFSISEEGSLDPSNGQCRTGRVPKRNLFILEEPTIGLHMADVQRLVESAAAGGCRPFGDRHRAQPRL